MKAERILTGTRGISGPCEEGEGGSDCCPGGTLLTCSQLLHQPVPARPTGDPGLDH